MTTLALNFSESILFSAGNDVLIESFSYLDIKDIQSLAKTCKQLNQLCYKDSLPAAKRRIEILYPGYAPLKPKNISYTEYYKQLQTASGIWYTMIKTWKEDQTRFDLSERFVEAFGKNLLEDSPVKGLDILALLSSQAGNVLITNGLVWFSPNYYEEGSFELIKTMQIPCLYACAGASAYFCSRDKLRKHPDKAKIIFNWIGKFCPLGQVCAIGNRTYRTLASGAFFAARLYNERNAD